MEETYKAPANLSAVINDRLELIHSDDNFKSYFGLPADCDGTLLITALMTSPSGDCIDTDSVLNTKHSVQMVKICSVGGVFSLAMLNSAIIDDGSIQIDIAFPESKEDKTLTIPFSYDFATDTLIFSDEYTRIFKRANVIRNFKKSIPLDNVVSRDTIDSLTEFLSPRRGYMFDHGSINIQLRNEFGKYDWYCATVANTFDAEGKPLRSSGFLNAVGASAHAAQSEPGAIEIDAQTGLYTKSVVEALLRKRLKSVTAEYPASLVLIKMDDMAAVNAKLGHLAVDTIISNFAFGLLSLFPDNIIGRIGGIDFLIYFDEKNMEELTDKINKIPEMLGAIISAAELSTPITVSIGVACSDTPIEYTSIMERSDAALCRAKSMGGNNIVFYSDEYESETLYDNALSDDSHKTISDDFIGRMWSKLVGKLYDAKDIRTGIYNAITFLGHTFKVDRITVLTLPSLNNSQNIVVQWRASDKIHDSVDMLMNLTESDIRAHPYDNTNDPNLVYVHDIATTSGKDREVLTSLGIVSHLLCMLKDNGGVMGFVNFEMCNTPRVWVQQEIDLLKMVSKLIEESVKQQHSLQYIGALHKKTKNIIANIASGIYVIDKKNYSILYFNEAMQRINPDIRLDAPCYEVLKGFSAPCPDCVLNELSLKNKNVRSTIKINSFDKPFDIVASEMIWSDNSYAYIINLTEHMESAEEAEYRRMQERLEKKYAFIYSHSCDYIVDIDINSESYSLTKINEKAFCPIKEPFGNYDKMFYEVTEKYAYPDDIKTVVNTSSFFALKKRLSQDVTSRHTEYRIINGDSILWEESSAFYIDDEDKPSVVIAYRDITEEKHLAELAMLDKQRLYLAVSNVYPLVLSVNLTKDLYSILKHDDFFTNTAQSIDGKYSEYLKLVLPRYHEDFRNTLLEFFSPANLIETTKSGRTQVFKEMRRLSDDNKFHWFSVLAIHVENTFDDDILAIILCKNIDAQKESENNLKLALTAAENANSAKSDFLSRMSHEIRTPMNAIIGMTELARNSVESKPTYALECLSKIDLSSHYLLSIINDILDMSRIESNRVIISSDSFNFRDLVSSVDTLIAPQAKAKGLNFEIIEKDISSESYIGDPIRINQVLVNLLSNSLKFTSAGGRITLEIEEKPCTTKGTVLFKFSVIDTGCGMSPEFLKKMYKPFEQEFASNVGKEHGTGLGLSISKNLIGLMGGYIQVESTLGVGTRFDIELELKLSETAVKRKYEAASKSTEYSFNNQLILLAEDNEINSEIAVALLEDKGLRVECAENGRIAVDMFKNSEEGYYNAILMDIMMPIMGGLEASKEIRDLDRPDAKTIPIIAMTANAFSEDITKSYAHGMNDHLAKPIEPKKLYDALQLYLK